MKNLTLTLMGMTALAMGCKDKNCADTAGGCDTGMGGEASFNLAWTDVGSTLEVSVSNPDVDGYFLGLAETGSGGLGWYGEDCVSDDAICHDMGEGSVLSLSSVHPEVSGLSASASRAAVVAGSTTLFHVGLWAGVTYVFFSDEGNTGYETVAHSGGDDSSFYE
jgi:hypothetical protein